MATENPERSLERLLHELFDADEFRVFLRRLDGGEKLEAALVGKVATTDLLVSEAVRALSRRGEIDEAFFSALIGERPKKRAPIQAVQEVWAAAPGSEGPARAASGAPARAPAAPPAAGSQVVHNHGPVGEQFNIQGGAHVFNLGKGRG